jgi:hypothetical protein
VAVNPNTSHPNKNTLYLACSGGGKSEALRQNTEIPKRGARVLLWDIDHDHNANRYETMQEFKRAVIAGVRSGRGFRIAYSGSDIVEAFEKFCEITWAILDGNLITFIVIEELADVSPSVSKATPQFGRLLRKCRKFGGRIHATSQRGAEIPKTAYTQCPIKWIGQQEGEDVGRMAKIAGRSSEEITALLPLSYFVKVSGPEPGQLITIKYKGRQ